jgi:hypothetical protein
MVNRDYPPNADDLYNCFSICRTVNPSPRVWSHLINLIGTFMQRCQQEDGNSGIWRGDGIPELITLYHDVLQHLQKKEVKLPEGNGPATALFTLPCSITPCSNGSGLLSWGTPECTIDQINHTYVDCCWPFLKVMRFN